MDANMPEDEEFRKLLRETLEQPMEWYDERAERAVKGAIAQRRAVRLPRKR
jgi:hypothetical protein